MPDNQGCPWCGATGRKILTTSGESFEYDCGLRRGTIYPHRPPKCYETELTTLRTQLEERERLLREAETLRLAVVGLYETEEFEAWAQGFAGHETTARIIQELWEKVNNEDKSFLNGELPDSEMVMVRRADLKVALQCKDYGSEDYDGVKTRVDAINRLKVVLKDAEGKE